MSFLSARGRPNVAINNENYAKHLQGKLREISNGNCVVFSWVRLLWKVLALMKCLLAAQRSNHRMMIPSI